jgi:hypothetical protein
MTFTKRRKDFPLVWAASAMQFIARDSESAIAVCVFPSPFFFVAHVLCSFLFEWAPRNFVAVPKGRHSKRAFCAQADRTDCLWRGIQNGGVAV